MATPRKSADDLRSLRILVAEDSAVNRLLVERWLVAQGNEVVTVENGRLAVEAVNTGRFDLVLMDIQMPELDGVEATAEIRRNEDPDRRLPIIALTAHAMGGDAERFRRAGMDAHLPKPFEVDELTALIDKLLVQPREGARPPPE